MASTVFASMFIVTFTHGVLVTKGLRSLHGARRRSSDQALPPRAVVSQKATIRLVAFPTLTPNVDQTPVWNFALHVPLAFHHSTFNRQA